MRLVHDIPSSVDVLPIHPELVAWPADLHDLRVLRQQRMVHQLTVIAILYSRDGCHAVAYIRLIDAMQQPRFLGIRVGGCYPVIDDQGSRMFPVLEVQKHRRALDLAHLARMPFRRPIGFRNISFAADILGESKRALILGISECLSKTRGCPSEGVGISTASVTE